jgi:uroporphyrinogen decarboxylase
MTENPFAIDVAPDWEALRDCIMREGTPQRVHAIELFLDWEVQEEIASRFGLLEGLRPDDPAFAQKREISIQRFLGYDYVRQGLDALDMPLHRAKADDTAALAREGGRAYMDEHTGPITNWDEFESYPWPDPEAATTRALEWYEENLPDDMCVIGSQGFAHFAELLTWLMGYETLCYSLFDQRDLVRAIADRLTDIYRVVVRRILEFDRVELVWGSDDMGFKTGPMISPDDLREFVLPGHKLMAQVSHDAGRPYLLHSCGNINSVMDDLIDDVRIDALHSFEDTILLVTDAKAAHGDRIALLGGIDVDFLCRADEEQIRRRVRDTLQVCQPGGGYCLGSGNSIANYIPVDNYLAMLDEGRRFAAS